MHIKVTVYRILPKCEEWVGENTITTIISWNPKTISFDYPLIRVTPLLKALNLVCNFEHYMAFIRAYKRKTKNWKQRLIVLDSGQAGKRKGRIKIAKLKIEKR